MRRGIFVSIEGGEGAGKSSVIAAARETLDARGIPYRMTREPGGTPLAEALRALVLDPANAGLTREAEVLMIFAARAQHVAEVIRPTLDAGRWVLSDRYTDASFAYQGGGRGVPVAALEWLEAFATGGLRPDRTILLDVDVDEGRRRVASRGEDRDRMEREDDDFFDRVRRAYLARAVADPGRFRIVDATRPLAQVVADVVAELKSLAAAWKLE
jgi:dTMP kinase